MNIDDTNKGQLVVLGTGIQAASHLTLEAESWLKAADVVCYVVADGITPILLRELNKNCVNLATLYADGMSRSITYERMIESVLEFVREGKLTCFALYGHAGVFVYPSHEAVKRARREGYSAKMLAGVSAEDCVFADLGFDPARYGCSSFEATDFLLHKRIFDPRSHLILWQIGVVAEGTFESQGYRNRGLKHVVARLTQAYGGSHKVIVYEASEFAVTKPKIIEIAISDLALCESITPISTLVVPPLQQEPVHVDMLNSLGLDEKHFIVEPDK